MNTLPEDDRSPHVVTGGFLALAAAQNCFAATDDAR